MLRFLILLICLSSSLHAQKQMCICAIFQNEAPYFQEWIEFHKLQGVEHFYLYNNNSDDHYLDALSPYVAKGDVTLIDWLYTYEPGKHLEWLKIQAGAYTHCLENYGKSISWLAAIDVDEFLYCPQGESLPEFLAEFKQYGGVCVNWLLFGTSFVEDLPANVLMIEALTRCSTRDHERNCRVKSIVQPQYVVKALNAHTFEYKQGYYAVGSDGKLIQGGNSSNILHDRICINHYWTRTEKRFREEKIESRHNRRLSENQANLRKMANHYNVSSDETILQFVPALRMAMGFD